MGKKVVTSVVKTAANQFLKLSVNFDKERDKNEVLVTLKGNDDIKNTLCHSLSVPTEFVKSDDLDFSVDNYIILEKLARNIEEILKAHS